MGRHRVYHDRVATSIRLPPALRDRLQAAADERDVSISFLVNRAVEDFLPRLIPVSEWRLTRPRDQAGTEDARQGPSDEQLDLPAAVDPPEVPAAMPDGEVVPAEVHEISRIR